MVEISFEHFEHSYLHFSRKILVYYYIKINCNLHTIFSRDMPRESDGKSPVSI